MKKQTFIQATVILVVIGMIVKVLGLLNKMLIARFLTPSGIGVYMLVMPTFILIISLAQLGFPISISKLVSENIIKQEYPNKVIVFKAFKISIINSLILISVLLLSAKFLAYNLLNEPLTYYPLLMLCFFIPLVSFSSILKGYLHGYKIISIPSYSQLIEQIIRIITSILLIIILLPYGIEFAVSGAIIANSLGELGSLIYMVYKIKQKRSWSIILSTNYSIKTDLTKDILSISIPTTGSRIIGSLSHFLEPIIFSFAMLSLGYSSNYITRIYGQITGYTVSLLLIPSFFSFALSTPLVPTISEAYTKKNYNQITYYFNMTIFLSFLVGSIFTIILCLYPNELMKLFFNTTEGVDFLSYMAPLFIIYYFQQPITTTLQAINKANKAMINTLLASIIKLLLIYVLVTNKSINVHGLTIAILINIFVVTIIDYYILQKTIKMKYNLRTIFHCLCLVIITYLLGSILKKYNLSFYLNTLIILSFYISLLFILNIGDIRKVKKQLFNQNQS